MAPQSRDEIMVRDSIEAKGDDDVDMEDATATTNGGAEKASVQTNAVAQDEDSADAQADATDEIDADGEAEEEVVETPTVGRPGRKRGPDTPHKRLIMLIDTTARYLSDYEENGEPLCQGFQRLPRRNDLPEYFEIIAEPIAFSTIRNHVMKKTYQNFSEFVRHLALICHNAQVFNRPSAPIFAEAVRLREVAEEKLQKLVQEGLVKPEEAAWPDLGEIPEVEDSPLPGEDEEGEEEDDEPEDEEEEEEDEEDDDSDDEGGRRRGRKRGRASKKADDDEDYVKKRGRPPKVFTPTEARISAVLKGIRKPRNDDGDLRILHFDRLPDKQLNKEYYQEIQNPIALEQIKRNAKRKKYRGLDGVLADLELMFNNAMRYNEDGSVIYDDAAELLKEARRLVEQEKTKPDDAFRDEEGKLPLSEVEHKGELWKVGDWVHIRNPNDLDKPIVAQIYRLWQDEAGKKCMNACWYYRPEQTVHRVSKRFYKNEVMKTGQYRDHLVDDIVDRCFVMFHTRYHKGRPRGFPPNKEVYVCEARYNDQLHTFNRIKTWTSCLPDEVRERDYEMELFNMPRKLKKEPTPIAHLLKEGAKETDPLPKPNWGHKDAPPVIGGVHIRPRELNDTPSPEPTPEPPVVPPPSMTADPIRRQSVPMPPAAPTAFHPGVPGPVPSPSPAHAHQQFHQSHFAAQQQQQPQQQHRPSFGRNPSSGPIPPQQQQQQQQQQHHQVPTPAHVNPAAHFAPPQQHPGLQFHQQPQQQQAHFAPAPVSAGHHHHIPNTSFHSAPFSHHHQATGVPQQQQQQQQQQRMPMAPTPSSTAIPHANANGNAYIPPRVAEVYTLRDGDGQIPAEVRDQYQTDDKGQILFFTAPPLNRPHPGVAEECATLGHSVRYLSSLQEHRAKRKREREERDEREDRDRAEKLAKEREAREKSETELGAGAGAMLGDWINGIRRDNERLDEEVASLRAEKAAWDAEKAAQKAAVNGVYLE